MIGESEIKLFILILPYKTRNFIICLIYMHANTNKLHESYDFL